MSERSALRTGFRLFALFLTVLLVQLSSVRMAFAEGRMQYAWRGFHLDEARHFFGKQTVKDYLERMHGLKLNVFHWHLTDDQGWRLDVPGFPELVRYGARRSSTPVPDSAKSVLDSDGKSYGPFFYTPEDVREIIAFATARGIRIVPEFDLPGHVRALLAAHPEFSCEGDLKREPWTDWGVCKDVLCAGNDDALAYCERVLDAIMEIFPSEYVHIGGDECPKDAWRNCPKCQARIRAMGLKDEEALQGWVTMRFVRHVTSRGKRPIGWDEILKGGDLPQETIIQNWHGSALAAEAARRGHDVIQSPCEWTYFTFPEGLPGDSYHYRSWVAGKNLSAEKMRSFSPVADVPEALRKHIIGAECCLWSEFVHDRKELDFKTGNRLAAFAEALSRKGNGNGANLIRNEAFLRDDFGVVRAWVLRSSEDVAIPMEGKGPDGSTALRLDLSKGHQYYQPGLKLVPEEPYRLSLYVRSKGHKDGGVQMMIRNPRWNRVGPKIPLPGDTQGEWRRVETTAVVPVAREDSYYAAFYQAEPRVGATLEIACPHLEAMSEKGRSGSRVADSASTVKARVVPIDPLLSNLDAKDVAMTWYFGGSLPKPDSAYRLEASLDGGDWVGAPLPTSRRVRLSHGAAVAGHHTFDVRIFDVAEKVAYRANVYDATVVAHASIPEGRRLNNFVTELLARPLADGAYSFAVPHKCYVFFDLGGKDVSATITLDGELKPLISPSARCWSEAVRMLDAGSHTLRARDVSLLGATLRVHAVRPVPHHGNALNLSKTDVPKYLYGRDFYDTFLPLFYTECGAPRKASRDILAWLAVTGVALCSEFDFTAASRASPEVTLSRIRENGAFDEGHDVWLDELGVVHPRDDHINLGEALWRIQGQSAVNVWWADAIRGWFDSPVVYTAETAGTVNTGDGRGSLYAEVYPAMKSTEESTYAQETNYIRFANAAAALVPAASNRTVFCFGGYISPEGWNTYPAPEGDYKVFFDHFMHRLATDPDFANAGGIGSTAFQHLDEEQVRFYAKVIRHYALEGRTDSLAERYGWKYLPGHLKNCDFAEGLKNWVVESAEPGSVVAAEIKGYGFNVQYRREVPVGYGDKLVKLTRSAKGPNRLKQTLTGLKPGAYYILTYHSTDEQDVEKPGTPCRDFVLRATLENAEILKGLSFDRLWPEDLNDKGKRANRPRDLKTHALTCTHRYVFRAKGETVELTVSDWADDANPGAPIGRTRLMNYMIVRPYYVGSEMQIPMLEEFVKTH